jgi:hypothetical protein
VLKVTFDMRGKVASDRNPGIFQPKFIFPYRIAEPFLIRKQWGNRQFAIMVIRPQPAMEDAWIRLLEGTVLQAAIEKRRLAVMYGMYDNRPSEPNLVTAIRSSRACSKVLPP